MDGGIGRDSLLRVVLPLSAPGLVITAIYTFILARNQFILPLSFISSLDKQAVLGGLYDFVSEEGVAWNLLMPSVVVAVIPVVILFTLSNATSAEPQRVSPGATITTMEEGVKVLLFGAAAEAAGTREEKITANGVSLSELFSMLTHKYPALGPMRGTLAFAINNEYASMDETVSAGDEVAVLPPVSGG